MSDEMRWTTDAQGVLLLPDIHDGSLVEICLAGDELKLAVQGDTKKTEFRFFEVSEANFTYWFGAIVADVMMWSMNDLRHAREEIPGFAWRTLLSGQVFENDLESAAKAIINRNPHSYLFVMTCSYGGELACVAKSMKVSSTNRG